MPRQTPQHAQAGPCNADVLDQTLPRLNCKKGTPHIPLTKMALHPLQYTTLPIDRTGTPVIGQREAGCPSHIPRPASPIHPRSFKARLRDQDHRCASALASRAINPTARNSCGQDTRTDRRRLWTSPIPPSASVQQAQFVIPSYRMAFPNTQHGNTLQPTSTSANSHHAARFALRRNLRGSKYTSHLVSTPHAI